MRINTSDIPGYDTMTTAEKLAALEGYDFQTDYTGYVKKELYDKAASDLESRRAANRANMSAAEREMASMRDQMDAMAQTLNGYKREKDIASLTAKYAKLGYGDLSEATAIAHLDGDNDTLFKNQQAVLDRTTAPLAAEIEEMKDIVSGKPKPKQQEQQQQQQQFDDFFDGLAGKPILTQTRLAARKQQQQGQQQPRTTPTPSPGSKEFEAGFLSSFDSYRRY